MSDSLSSMPRRKVLLIGAAIGAWGVGSNEASASVDVVLQVKSFSQTKEWSCWVAAAVIMLRWKNGLPLSELDVAKMAGSDFETAFLNDKGLKGSEISRFATSLGLTTEAPQTYLPSGYETLLKTYGPLWVGSSLDAGTSNARRHVRVLRGIKGDGGPNTTTMFVLDPAGGRDYEVSYKAFSDELEQIAKEEIGVGGSLFPQVIRFP